MGFNPHTNQVAYELWVARDQKLAGMMRADRRVVYDLAGKKKADVGSGDIVAVDDVELAKVTKMASSCLGFTLADVPPDAVWDRVDGDGNREVYELTWTSQTYAGRGVGFKYEVTIDKATMLPESLRTFRWDSMMKEWKCMSLTVFEYPTEADVTAFVSGKSLAGTDR